MHSFQLITALGALFAAVAAVPVKRDTVVSTVTEIDVVTEYATETVWVDATGSPSTVQAVPTTSATTTSTYVAPVAPATTAQATTQAQVTVQPAAATTPSTTSTYVAPPVTSTISSTSSTDTTPVTTAAPTSTTTTAAAAPAATTSVSSSSNAVGSTYTGDITYYSTGLGSCGVTNTDSDMIVAVSSLIMNKATMCGKTITISYGGSTHQATVQDTCPSCASGSLDLSPSLFQAVAPSGDGRVHDVEWWFN